MKAEITLLDDEETKLSDGCWHVVFGVNFKDVNSSKVVGKSFILREDAKKYYNKLKGGKNVK